MGGQFINILMMILISGCAGMSYAELESESLLCKPVESEECTELRVKFDRAYKARIRRMRPECPSGYILLDRGGRYSCIDSAGLRIFRSPF